MKANELRIGNIITDKWSTGKYPFKVTSIGKTKCTYFGNQEFNAKYENIEPVILTVDILSKCGITKRFPSNESCNLYDFDNFKELTVDGNNKGQGFICLACFEDKEGWLDLQTRTWLKYLHQLQNHFFALTGIELPVSL